MAVSILFVAPYSPCAAQIKELRRLFGSDIEYHWQQLWTPNPTILPSGAKFYYDYLALDAPAVQVLNACELDTPVLRVRARVMREHCGERNFVKDGKNYRFMRFDRVGAVERLEAGK